MLKGEATLDIHNMYRLPEDCVETYAKGVATAYLGRFAKSQKLYVNIDTLPTGTYSAKYHAHSKQEEFFIILSGSGILRMNGEDMLFKEGDFVSKKCGDVHQFFNSGTVPMKILDIGTNEEGDICTYPDEGVVLLRDEKKAFLEKSVLLSWTSDRTNDTSV